MAEDPLIEEVRAHDAGVRARKIELWIGAEPTFTVRESQAPEWLVQAEGGEKLEKAIELLRAVVSELGVPARFFRATGRHFPGEPEPRFCLGAEWPRGSQGMPGPSEVLREGPVEAPPARAPGRAWLTVTPDPGVVEVNLPPSAELEGFLAIARATYRAASACGVSAERFRFNGEATDSGGGGQITLGGATPESSPFFSQPWLLPAVLRFLHNHPSLSYAFAGECVGSASQGPRPDEGVRERFEELAVALDRLEARGSAVTPEELWGSLAPLLVDAAGNTHRAEVNVEKLWNPGLSGRGLSGLVEFRALRMPRTPEKLAAVGALFRSLCARLASSPNVGPLREWGTELHERWGLPYFLDHDLDAVLEDLAEHGVGLGPTLTEILRERDAPLFAASQPGAMLELREALEFWPLLGDVASQERLTARLVDPSTRRVEFRLTLAHGLPRGRVGVCGWEVPLEPAGQTENGEVLVGAVRYRAYVPSPGLHAGLPAHDPLEVVWEHAGQVQAFRLHGWKPEGGPYTGLPRDADEARLRRQERRLALGPQPLGTLRPPTGIVPGHPMLDLRRLPAN